MAADAWRIGTRAASTGSSGSSYQPPGHADACGGHHSKSIGRRQAGSRHAPVRVVSVGRRYRSGTGLCEWLALAAALAALCASAAASGSGPRCKGGRGMLFGGAPPGPQPGLSFCRHYTKNSCCLRNHTDLVLAELLPTIKADLASKPFSPKCTEATIEAKCAICEPAVGMGMLPTVCASFCKRWHRACADDLFSFSESKQRLVPCGAEELICSPGKLVAAGPAEFCSLMGLPPSDGECWGGASEPVDISFAAAADYGGSGGARSSSRGGTWSFGLPGLGGGGGGKQALVAAAAGTVLLGVGLLLFRVQAALKRERAGQTRGHRRDKVALAAEERRLKRSA
eukprot:tig00000076_g2433.t1